MKFPIPTLALLLAAGTAAAEDIRFTGEQRYESGTLHRQAEWKEFLPGTFTVDADEGVLTYKAIDKTFLPAHWMEDLGDDGPFDLRVTFRLVLDKEPPPENRSLMRIGLDAAPDRNHLGVIASIIRRKTPNPSFTLGLFKNPVENAWKSSGAIPGGKIGLVETGDGMLRSEPLTLRLVTNRKEGNTWTSTAILTRAGSEEGLLKVDLEWEADRDWTRTDKFLRLDTAEMGRSLGGGRVEISTIHLKNLLP